MTATTPSDRLEREQSVLQASYSEQAQLLAEGQVAGGPDDGALPELPPPAHFDGWHNGRNTAYMLSRLLEAWLYPPATGHSDVDFANVATQPNMARAATRAAQPSRTQSRGGSDCCWRRWRPAAGHRRPTNHFAALMSCSGRVTCTSAACSSGNQGMWGDETVTVVPAK